MTSNDIQLKPSTRRIGEGQQRSNARHFDMEDDRRSAHVARRQRIPVMWNYLIVPTVAAVILGGALSVRAYEVVEIGTAGAIRGKVTYSGPSPVKRTIIPTKDKEVCGGGAYEIDQIVLAPNNAVEQAMVYLRDIAKGKAWDKPLKTAAIENSSCAFRPDLQIIPAGDIEIVNSDPVLHNTHGFLDKRTVFNVALPHQGLRVKKALRTPGMVRVECDAHGWMLGWIYVAENPYYAITSGDGTFALGDVPPGTYTLVTWHDYTGAVEMTVTVRTNETAYVTVELKK